MGMIKRIKEKKYKFKHPLGVVVIDEVEVGVSSNGRRSISALELERLSRIAVLSFLKKHYRNALTDSSFTLSSKMVRSILEFLSVNQKEFGLLIGCQKPKVTKILQGTQLLSKSQMQLVFERLVLELERPGSIRNLLGDYSRTVSKPIKAVTKDLDELRFKDIA